MTTPCAEPIFAGLTLPEVLSLVQLSIVAVSAWIATCALKTSARTARADAQYKLLKEGRDLRIKFNEAYRISDAGERDAALDSFRGLIIAYYAGCFELAEQVSLTDKKIKMLQADLCGVLRDPDFRAKWKALQVGFSREFRAIVASCGV